MNLILFDKKEIEHPLPLTDERAKHIRKVLKLVPGDSLHVGLVDGPQGTAILRKQSPLALEFDFEWGEDEPALDPITLIVGLARPHTIQKILQQATAMGVSRMIFIRTETGERSYASSKLWTTGDYKRHLVLGAQQAFSTRMPVVEYGISLSDAMQHVENSPHKYVLHNGDATMSLARMNPVPNESIVLAIGSERGWTEKELDICRQNNFVPTGMGPRILRTETAVVAALALVKAATGAW